MKLTVIGPMHHSATTWRVHAAGCKNVAKDALKCDRSMDAEGYESRLEVSEDLNQDFIEEGSMTAEAGLHDITFCNCCKGLR